MPHTLQTYMPCQQSMVAYITHLPCLSQVYRPTQHPTLFLEELDASETHRHSARSYSYDPTPGPSVQVSPSPNKVPSSTYQTTFKNDPPGNQYQSSQLAFALFNKPSIRFSRKKRSFVFPGVPSGPPGIRKQKSVSEEENLIKEKLLKEIVTQVLLDVIEKN